jgi:hypothetical protein
MYRDTKSNQIVIGRCTMLLSRLEESMLLTGDVSDQCLLVASHRGYESVSNGLQKISINLTRMPTVRTCTNLAPTAVIELCRFEL